MHVYACAHARARARVHRYALMFHWVCGLFGRSDEYSSVADKSMTPIFLVSIRTYIYCLSCLPGGFPTAVVDLSLIIVLYEPILASLSTDSDKDAQFHFLPQWL